MDCSTPGSSSFTISWSFLIFMSIDSMILSNHLIFWNPFSPFAFNLSQHQGLFQWISSLHQVAKYLSFSSSISPSNKYSGLFSFLTGFISLPSKGLSRVFSSTIQKHQFFSAQPSLWFSHLYLTTGKIIASTIQTFGSKVMSLFFNMLSWLS